MRIWVGSITLGLLCISMPIFGQIAETTTAETEIAVTGSAVAYVKSDYATVLLTISSTSKKAEEATQKTAEKYQRVIDALRDLDVLDVRTQQCRISPRWKRDERGEAKKFLGYQANHNVIVSLADIESVDEVVDAVVKAGVREVGALNFHSGVTDSLQQVTLDAAARQARKSAETIAAAAGGSLGDLIEMSTRDAVRALHRANPAGTQFPRVVAGTSKNSGAIQVTVVVLARWKFVEGVGQP